jgi:hypothetical protein
LPSGWSTVMNLLLIESPSFLGWETAKGLELELGHAQGHGGCWG